MVLSASGILLATRHNRSIEVNAQQALRFVVEANSIDNITGSRVKCLSNSLSC